MRSPLPLIALLLLAALLVAPASAELIGHLPDSAHIAYADTTRHIDLNAYDPGQEVIADVIFVVSPGTTVDFTLYAYDQIISGEINRTLTGPKSEIITYRLGENQTGPYEASSLFGLLDLGPHTYTLRYGADSDGALRLWLQNHNKGIGWRNPAVDIPDVAYRITATSSKDVELTISTAPSDDMHAAISGIWDLGESGIIQAAKGIRELGELIWLVMGGVFLVVSLGWYCFQKIFVENFLLFAGLFEVVGMAYAANKSRDIFQFLKKVVEYNAAAIKAMFWFIHQIVTIIDRVVDALKPL